MNNDDLSREEALRRLQTLEKRLQEYDTIFDATPIMFWYKDNQNRLLRVNRAAAALEGTRPEALEQRDCRDLYPAAQAEAFYRDDLEVMSSGVPKLGYIEQHRAVGTGQNMWLEVGKVPVTDNSGNVNGVIAFAMDVTTRVNLEEQLRQTTKMESIGRLAGGIAHDFNNILGGIIGASELIRRKAAAQDIRTINDIILEAAGRASDLVKRLLVFARQESHTDSPLNLHRVIENTLTLIGTLLAPRFTIRKELHAEIDRILGDPAEMQSALINIMCNARDAMPDGGTIDISTRNRFIEPSQDTFSHLMPEKKGLYIELSITDHGTGMTAETASRMFDPFYTTKSIGRGTGLGLATVYGSLKQHGGAIDVSSAPGRGTAIRLFLPVTDQKPITDAPPAWATLPTGSGRILLVDDEESIRTCGQALLLSLGYEVQNAPDGEAALRYLDKKENRVDAVIMDVVMPGMHGGELLQAIRSRMPDMPVLMMSGHAFNIQESDLLIAGATMFLSKPFSLFELAQAVHRLLNVASPANPDESSS